MIWVINRQLLLRREETVAATTEDVVEVHEADGEDESQDEEKEVGPEEETVVVPEDFRLGQKGEPHDIAEEDVAANTDGDVDLGVFQAEHDPAVIRATPAEVVRLGEGEKCEDRQHDERGMVPQDGQRGDLEVQGGEESQQELGQIQDGATKKYCISNIDFPSVHQLKQK